MFNKNILLSSRPKLKDYTNKRIPADVILCLLNPNELKGETNTEQLARDCGYVWYNIPSDARPWSDAVSPVPHWLDVAYSINEWLTNGSTIFIHCAAGIHRTGLAAYTYYRQYAGANHKQAMECLRQHRPVIITDIGTKLNIMKEYFDGR